MQRQERQPEVHEYASGKKGIIESLKAEVRIHNAEDTNSRRKALDLDELETNLQDSLDDLTKEKARKERKILADFEGEQQREKLIELEREMRKYEGNYQRRYDERKNAILSRVRETATETELEKRVDFIDRETLRRHIFESPLGSGEGSEFHGEFGTDSAAREQFRQFLFEGDEVNEVLLSEIAKKLGGEVGFEPEAALDLLVEIKDEMRAELEETIEHNAENKTKWTKRAALTGKLGTYFSVVALTGGWGAAFLASSSLAKGFSKTGMGKWMRLDKAGERITAAKSSATEKVWEKLQKRNERIARRKMQAKGQWTRPEMMDALIDTFCEKISGRIEESIRAEIRGDERTTEESGDETERVEYDISIARRRRLHEYVEEKFGDRTEEDRKLIFEAIIASEVAKKKQESFEKQSQSDEEKAKTKAGTPEREKGVTKTENFARATKWALISWGSMRESTLGKWIAQNAGYEDTMFGSIGIPVLRTALSVYAGYKYGGRIGVLMSQVYGGVHLRFLDRQNRKLLRKFEAGKTDFDKDGRGKIREYLTRETTRLKDAKGMRAKKTLRDYRDLIGVLDQLEFRERALERSADETLDLMSAKSKEIEAAMEFLVEGAKKQSKEAAERRGKTYKKIEYKRKTYEARGQIAGVIIGLIPVFRGIAMYLRTSEDFSWIREKISYSFGSSETAASVHEGSSMLDGYEPGPEEVVTAPEDREAFSDWDDLAKEHNDAIVGGGAGVESTEANWGISQVMVKQIEGDPNLQTAFGLEAGHSHKDTVNAVAKFLREKGIIQEGREVRLGAEDTTAYILDIDGSGHPTLTEYHKLADGGVELGDIRTTSGDEIWHAAMKAHMADTGSPEAFESPAVEAGISEIDPIAPDRHFDAWIDDRGHLIVYDPTNGNLETYNLPKGITGSEQSDIIQLANSFEDQERLKVFLRIEGARESGTPITQIDSLTPELFEKMIGVPGFAEICHGYGINPGELMSFLHNYSDKEIAIVDMMNNSAAIPDPGTKHIIEVFRSIFVSQMEANPDMDFVFSTNGMVDQIDQRGILGFLSDHAGTQTPVGSSTNDKYKEFFSTFLQEQGLADADVDAGVAGIEAPIATEPEAPAAEAPAESAPAPEPEATEGPARAGSAQEPEVSELDIEDLRRRVEARGAEEPEVRELTPEDLEERFGAR